MKDIIKKAEKLSEKRTWVRDSIKKFMSEWCEITKNISGIESKTALGDDGVLTFYLTTAKTDLATKTDNKTYDFGGRENYFYNIMTISDLRCFIKKLPQAIKEIEEQIDEETKHLEGLTDFFKKFN